MYRAGLVLFAALTGKSYSWLLTLDYVGFSSRFPGNGHCPNLMAFASSRAELQLGHSVCVKPWASGPEASGVKTPDETTLNVWTEVPISYEPRHAIASQIRTGAACAAQNFDDLVE
jgi:hypothetical protein